MTKRKYWLDLFTYETWTEFLKSGGNVSGFRKSRWNTVQKITPGDYLICYLTGVSRWIGILEVTGRPYIDEKNKIWGIDLFPARLPVKPLIRLELINAVPILSMKHKISIFENLKSPNAWTSAIRSSPLQWSKSDGEAIITALEEAVRNPQEWPFNQAKLEKTSPIFKTKNIGVVTIPEDASEPLSDISEGTLNQEIGLREMIEAGLAKEKPFLRL